MFKNTLTHIKKYALPITGAVVLASGAFAVGTQTGGGLAVAGDAPGGPAGRDGCHRGGPFGHRGGAGLQILADRLGVDVEKLRTAQETLRRERPRGDRRSELTTALAAGLKVPEARVQAALGQARPDRPRAGPPGEGERPRRAAFAAALARGLDVETSAVQTVLDEQREARRDAMTTALARELDIPVERVKEALPAGKPFGRGHGRGQSPPGGAR